MSEQIKCPMCPQTGDICDHDQDERRILCKEMNVREELEPQVYNSANVEQINAKRSKAKRKTSDSDNDVRAIMKRPEGRRFVAAQLERCHVFRTSVEPSNIDPHRILFAEGERNIGLQLLADITRLCMPDYLLMLKERSSEDAAA